MAVPVLNYAAPDIERHRKRGLLFLGLAVGLAGFAMALQLGLNNNFLVEQIGVSPLQMGLLEAVRESCGIVAFLFLALLTGLAEPLIALAVLVVFGLGLGGYAAAPSYLWVIALSLVWSQGLHIWMPLPNSMTLALAEEGKAGYRLGQMGSAGAGGFAVGIAAALALTLGGVPIRPMYWLAGGSAVLAGAACLGIPRQIRAPGARLVFRRRYGLYYLLCFLEGWRKQIFMCFAGYLLVRNHKAPLRDILMLTGAVQVIAWLVASRVGRLIDRIGERPVLIFYYACLTVFFLGYATIDNRMLLYGLFVIDNAFFVFAMALTTYVNRLAPQAEHTATLSMGVAMNHVAAVAMPLVGGIVWSRFGHRWTFAIGASAAAASILVAMRLPRRN